jgi:hypothetical protein
LTFRGDWHPIPVPLWTQILGEGIGAAAADVAVTIPAAAKAPTANSGAKWVSLVLKMVLLIG